MRATVALLSSACLALASAGNLMERTNVTKSGHPSTSTSSSYSLNKEFSGETFFDGFNFATYSDPTHGAVDYVDYGTAEGSGLINVTNEGQIYMGADHTTTNAWDGRQSVRLESKTTYSEGLFVIDLEHMPTGCATWPAFWLVGPSWPSGGEIDIIEGVDDTSTVASTLHTNDGCSMYGQSTEGFTGTMETFDCNVDAAGQADNEGCGIIGPDSSMGVPFNDGKGGVYATELDPEGGHIRVWFWKSGSEPDDVHGSNPDPTSWGTPYAYFSLGDECPSSHFSDMQIIFDLTFCGDWDEYTYPTCAAKYGFPSSCTEFVANYPSEFTQAYWTINSVKVFSK